MAKNAAILSSIFLVVAIVFCFNGVQAGVPLVGYGGNTFNEIFSTGFQNGLGGYGAGTVAGAIGYYSQFSGIGTVGVGDVLTAGKNHGGGGGYGGIGAGGYGH